MTDEEFEKYIEDASEGLPSIEEVNMAILEQIAEGIEITPRNETLISNTIARITEQRTPYPEGAQELYMEFINNLDKLLTGPSKNVEEYHKNFPQNGKISGN
jgi:TFIIF-interacting CTD phosphatase-like protein